MIPARLEALLRASRRREWLCSGLLVLPWLGLAAAATAWRGLDAVSLTSLALAALALLLEALRLRRALRRKTLAWLLGQLEDHRPDSEDSADLIARDPSGLAPLAALQRQRVLDRLASGPLPDLRRRLPWRALLASVLLAALVLPGILYRPTGRPAAPAPEAPSPAVAVAQALSAELDITPPAYTGLAPRRIDRLNAEVAQDSLLRWRLRFAVAPEAARLEFVDGSTLALRREADDFAAEATISRSTLYRIVLDGAPALPDSTLQRIDVISDRPPQLSVRQPERTLTVLESGQGSWTIEIEAEDDYGLGSAELSLTLAQGSGEQVTVSERRIALQGEGDARRRRYRQRVDLAALGFARGDDLIARLEVTDNRQPTAQRSRSPALILRWPYRPSAEGSGVEGLVQRTLPAYFRSQRQIILDTEALIAERPRPDEDSWLARSDAIGVDQRILRMRYGQFLGEESESGALPGSGPPRGGADAHSEAPADAAHDHPEPVGGAEDGHDHDHGPAPAAGAFGEAGGLIAEVGHLHDIAEAATLLDPRTRELLRGALREMWQAEGHLRLGQPQQALPYEYRALELIKQVQQANRIYLARVGLELPAVDFSRRLSGEGRPRQRPVDPLSAGRADGTDLAGWWQALDGDEALPLDAIASWLAAPPDGLRDPLAALADVDALRRQPDCRPCRKRLQDQLWPLLPMPAARPAMRRGADPAAQGYLDALPASGGSR